MNTIQDHLHLPPFAIHLPNDGSNIGGKQPTGAYGAVPNPDGTTTLYVGDNPYATIMLHGHQPWPGALSSGQAWTRLQMNVTFQIYGPNLLLELDTQLGLGKSYANLSSQWRRYDPDNGKARLQTILPGSTEWKDVPGTDIPWSLPAGTHTATMNYLVSPTPTFVDYVLDGTLRFPVDRVVPVINEAWTQGPSWQDQLTVNEKGGNCGLIILEQGYVWSL